MNITKLPDNPLVEGGEGYIYEKNNKIWKIFKNTVNLSEKESKLKLLISKKLPNNIIKPLDLIYKNNKFVGYVMNKIDGDELKRLTNRKFVKLHNITNKDVIYILIKIKEILKLLHSKNIIIGDLNDNNILFDDNNNVFFIDCDSWTIDNYKCSVCMDTFKDVLLKLNNFTFCTDYFSFAVLAFKMLTRIHPYGGTTQPDMNILERMKKRISVLSNSYKIKTPKNILGWSYIHDSLIIKFKEIFENDKRYLIDSDLDKFHENLKMCKSHNIYYYSKFNDCPLCNMKAKVLELPEKISKDGEINYYLFYQNNNVKTLLDIDIFMNNKNEIQHRYTNKTIKYENRKKYFFSNDGQIIYTQSKNKINLSNSINIDIKYNTSIKVYNDLVYYINKNNELTKSKIIKNNIGNWRIEKVSNNVIYDIKDDDTYFIVNIFDNNKILNINGYNYILNNNDKILNYNLSYDLRTSKWLFVYETQKNEFFTCIFDKNVLQYKENKIRYGCSLNNICFYNNTIFIPYDGYIRGFNYKHNKFKDFDCNIISTESKLIKDSKYIFAINEKNIYKIG
jgi:serine/threonine protein kinase